MQATRTDLNSRVVLEIDLAALRRNYQRVRDYVNPLGIMAVLKANAYGLGVGQIASALQKEGVSFFGVAEPREGIEIAELGVPTLILGNILEDEIEEALYHDLVLPIDSFASAKRINDIAVQMGKLAVCHCLLDTGMGRLGLPAIDAVSEIRKMRSLENIELEGIYTHFPVGYNDETFSNAQIDTLMKIAQASRHRFNHIHISNSDGIHNVPMATKHPFTLARTGINLYGCFDLEGRRTLPLEEVIHLKSRLLTIRKLRRGDSIGYGRTHILKKDTLIGTVPIGYADGMPLRYSNGGVLIVNGVRCSIVGRTSMDYTTISLENAPDAQVGDSVTCLGKGIPVSDWAHAKGTIPYEVICSLGNRVERVYLR